MRLVPDQLREAVECKQILAEFLANVLPTAENRARNDGHASIIVGVATSP